MNKSRKFAALIIITIILIAFGSTARAQEDEDDDEHGIYLPDKHVFYGGLIGGVNFAQVDGDYFAGYYKKGANVGGIVYAQLAKHVALSMEILYSQKGSKSNLPEPSPHNASVILIKYGINNNYAEVPVMINYFDKRKSHFGVGLSYSRLVSSTETLESDSSNVMQNLTFSNTYPFKKVGLDFLAGVELHLIKGLFLNVRFQYSAIPIRTQLPPPDYARANQYSNLWTVRLMYLFK